MNLVQLAEHAKNLSNDQLQMMLQRPDGAVPPFILAAEAARRQDIERSAQMQPAQPTTVLDDLIQSRSTKAGIGQLPGQMANQPEPQAQQPQMPQQAPPQMRSGGQVRRFMDGSIVNAGQTTTFLGAPYDPSKDLFGGFPGLYSGIASGISSAYDYATKPWSETYGPAAGPNQVQPFFSANGDRSGDGGVSGLTSEENARDIAGVQRRARATTPNYIDPKAAEKQLETAKKEEEMGANPTATAVPTTENSSDAAAIRERIMAAYGYKDTNDFLGIDSLSYAAMSKALLDTTPGTSSGERWANAAMALAAGERADQEKAKEAEREGALALLNYDIRQDDRLYQEGREDEQYAREKADADARFAKEAEKSRIENRVSGLKVYAATAKDKAEFYQKQIDALAKPYTEMNAIPPEDVAKKINEYIIERNKYLSMYSKYQENLATGVYGVAPIEVADDTGRPTPG